MTPLRHVGTHTPQRLSLLLELDVGLGHGLGEAARAARLLQQRQQVRAVQDARGGVLADRKRPAREESPQPLHGGRRTQPDNQRLPCRVARARQRRHAEVLRLHKYSWQRIAIAFESAAKPQKRYTYVNEKTGETAASLREAQQRCREFDKAVLEAKHAAEAEAKRQKIEKRLQRELGPDHGQRLCVLGAGRAARI